MFTESYRRANLHHLSGRRANSFFVLLAPEDLLYRLLELIVQIVAIYLLVDNIDGALLS